MSTYSNHEGRSRRRIEGLRFTVQSLRLSKVDIVANLRLGWDLARPTFSNLGGRKSVEGFRFEVYGL
jgi:hypothetical protein